MLPEEKVEAFAWRRILQGFALVCMGLQWKQLSDIDLENYGLQNLRTVAEDVWAQPACRVSSHCLPHATLWAVVLWLLPVYLF